MRSSRFFSSWNCARARSRGVSMTPAAVNPAVAVFRKSRRFAISFILCQCLLHEREALRHFDLGIAVIFEFNIDRNVPLVPLHELQDPLQRRVTLSKGRITAAVRRFLHVLQMQVGDAIVMFVEKWN